MGRLGLQKILQGTSGPISWNLTKRGIVVPDQSERQKAKRTTGVPIKSSLANCSFLKRASWRFVASDSTGRAAMRGFDSI